MLSTPLTRCSIGVATDCSIVCASAPTYLANILISGGAISGNCATGSLTIDTAPRMIVTMAITIATIGRLMKNLDIGFGGDLHALPNFLRAFRNDALSSANALID